MISADGWLDWAIRMPGPPDHTNAGTSSVKGVFMHSAEGYAGTLLDPRSPYGFAGNHSFHGSNLMDGRFIQHYPFLARCWHATKANQEYVGIENEGDYPREVSLNELQIRNAVRLIEDLQEWKGWQATRPTSPTDISHTLWEHREVVRLGGSATECPSGRIPWDEILRRLKEVRMPDNPTEDQLRLGVIETIVNGKYKPVYIGPNALDERVVELRNQDGTPAQPPVILAVPKR